jgi:uncharacterized membrane protein
MMIAITEVMLLAGLGTVSLPMVRATIAHIPILIAAVVCGLPHGLMVGLAFGATTLVIALTSPVSVLDPFFVNPLISVLPRLLIPVTTYYVFKCVSRLTANRKAGQMVSLAIAFTAGNLTNTFGVYLMLYLVYAREIMEKTGTPAITLILGLMATSTLLKCAVVVLICTPLALGLRRALKFTV